MDQGTLLECFCLHNINHKAVNEQQAQKNGIIFKYGHLRGTALNMLI